MLQQITLNISQERRILQALMPNKHPGSNVHCTLWIQNDCEAKWKNLSN